MSDTISLLKQYGEDVGGVEQTLAFVASRWLAVEPTAISDPLLTDLLAKAQFYKATHNGTDTSFFRMPERTGLRLENSETNSLADSFLFGAPKRAKGSIMEYFGSGTANISLLESLPVARTSSGASASTSTRARIYCDGACTANGRKGAKAGFGGILLHADGTEETVSEALSPTESQTNQRGELRGLQWAFTKAMSLPEGADIYTDSEYAIKCFTEWGAGWAVRGWRKSDGKDVLHQDILKPMWETWKRRGNQIRLHHVSAHTGRSDIHSKGNARADALATASIH
jgi:ribonuclease HI